ncbi:MAG TPA: hypothetical protein VM580_03640 [Labilithrix sp.]|nr:hypothetical protein [Labilithrix sp.]
MSEAKEARREIGPHEVWFEPEAGFVGSIQNGRLEEEHATELVAYFSTHSNDGDGSTFLILDARKATGHSADARNVFMGSEVLRKDFHVAMFGPSFALRSFINVITKGLVLTGYKISMHAAADEESARAWLRGERRAYVARKASVA